MVSAFGYLLLGSLVTILVVATVTTRREWRREDAERSCEVCHCTDADCTECVERTGSPCHWVGENLCSAGGDASWDSIQEMFLLEELQEREDAGENTRYARSVESGLVDQ